MCFMSHLNMCVSAFRIIMLICILLYILEWKLKECKNLQISSVIMPSWIFNSFFQCLFTFYYLQTTPKALDTCLNIFQSDYDVSPSFPLLFGFGGTGVQLARYVGSHWMWALLWLTVIRDMILCIFLKPCLIPPRDTGVQILHYALHFISCPIILGLLKSHHVGYLILDERTENNVYSSSIEFKGFYF